MWSSRMNSLGKNISTFTLTLGLLVGVHALAKAQTSLAQASSSSAYTILIVGDSLTEGYSIPKDKAYPAQLEQKLRSIEPSVQVINAGVSGATSKIAAEQIQWQLKKRQLHLIILALGANDGLRGLPVAQMKKHLQAGIDLAQNAKVPLLLIGMRLPTNYDPKYRQQFEEAFAELARQNNLDFLPFLLEGVALDKKLNLNDMIHPNEEGHKKIADLIYPYISKHLKTWQKQTRKSQ